MSGGALVLEPQTLGICAFFDSEKAALIGMEYIREKIIKFLRLYNINGIITPRNDIIINEKKLGGFTKSPKLINNNYIIV